MPASSTAWAMASTFPAASAVTAGSGSGAVPTCCLLVPGCAVSRGGLADTGRAADRLGYGRHGVGGAARAGVSAGGASSRGASGAAGVQVSAMPDLLPPGDVQLIRAATAMTACRVTLRRRVYPWSCRELRVKGAER